MIKITKDKVKETLALLMKMEQRKAYVGVPGEKTTRKMEGVPAQPINNVTLAAIHDRGAPKARIPARPFMGPGVEKVKEAIAKDMAKCLQRDLSMESLDLALNRAGLRAQTSIKKVITSQEGFAPLAPKTLALRKKKKFKGTKALIHTGQLLNSVTYVLRDS